MDKIFSTVRRIDPFAEGISAEDIDTSSLTLFFTVGLPGSGKSTFAHALARSSGIAQVCKDDIRALPQAPKSRGKCERWTVQRQDEIIASALGANKSIVVHDTNFNPVHVRRFLDAAKEHGAEVVMLDFTPVPVDECVRRDLARSASVGKDVIVGMWQQYLYSPPASTPEEGLEDAVMVDIDGTLARMNGRSAFEWHRVGEDEPVAHIVDLVRDLHSAGTKIIYMSGRSDVCQEQTQRWLDENVAVPGPLYMRPASDNRKDSIVKLELFDRHIRGRYRIRFVLDDRDSVIHAWRTAGIPALQVEYGTF